MIFTVTHRAHAAALVMLPSNLQLLKLQYREFLRKTAAYHHRSEGGEACAHTYYVERAWSEASFEDSFTKLSQLLTTFKLSELRASYHVRKERAKERFRRAFDARVSRLGKYLGKGEDAAANELSAAVVTPSNGDTPPASASARRHVSALTSNDGNQDLQELFGTDGLLRVSTRSTTTSDRIWLLAGCSLPDVGWRLRLRLPVSLLIRDSGSRASAAFAESALVSRSRVVRAVTPQNHIAGQWGCELHRSYR